jgi:hypothetical protein
LDGKAAAAGREGGGWAGRPPLLAGKIVARK